VAKDIADIINNGGMVPAGVIPPDTEIIWYSIHARDSVQLVEMRPNPFSSAVSIGYRVPEARAGDQACVEIFDVRGRRVFALDDLDMAPGEHAVFWTGQDFYGNDVTSGTYFVSVRSTYGVTCSKITLIRSE
jgi:flagellar hook assembly protein FlgD